MKLLWNKTGELYDRVYTATGERGSYRIDLDQAADRWVIYVKETKCVEDIYYIKNAQRIAEGFEANGLFAVPPNLRPRPDGRTPHILARKELKTEEAIITNQILAPASFQSLPRPITPIVATRPTPDVLALKLEPLIRESKIIPEQSGTPWLPWQSGVYALVDCIFSAQSDYKGVVLPLLSRMANRPNLEDNPDLCFSAFIADVDKFGSDKYEQYAIQVLTRNKIAGRLKTEICCEAARFFAKRGLETMADLHALGDKLEPLILEDLQTTIFGIGPALAHYLLTLFGDEDHVKLDVMITRFWARMKDWQPRPSHTGDYQVVLETFRNVASHMKSTPARLDNAIWNYESSQVRR
jgi:hypothetical protein